MSKMFQFHEDALRSILRGVNTLSQAVAGTLGPQGRNVMIQQEFGSVLLTKDGEKVAKEVFLQNKFENMGAQLVKEASFKTGSDVGDGTTTAIILAEAIYAEGVKAVVSGASPAEIKRGIDKAIAILCRSLDEMAIKIEKPEEIRQIATIAANNDPDIGAIIAQAFEQVGKNGMITTVAGQGIETTVEVVEGFEFDRGYLSPYFSTNPEKMTAELDSPLILITDKKFSSMQEIASLLEKIMEEGQKSLLMIVGDIEAEALSTLVINKVKAGFTLCAVKAPAFGDEQKFALEDLSLLTGATILTDKVGVGLKDFKLSMLGRAKQVKVSKDKTTIIQGAGNSKEIQKRVAELSRSSSKDKKVEERAAKLQGNIAVIYIGAKSETEMQERKGRVEDALSATHAAILEGIVPGGGVALLRAAASLDSLPTQEDEQFGVGAVFKACFAQTTLIANNCGEQGNLIAEKVYERQGAWGYNAVTCEFADLVKEQVVDPVKVIKTALQNAASIAGTLLTATVLVTDKK